MSMTNGIQNGEWGNGEGEVVYKMLSPIYMIQIFKTPQVFHLFPLIISD